MIYTDFRTIYASFLYLLKLIPQTAIVGPAASCMMFGICNEITQFDIYIPACQFRQCSLLHPPVKVVLAESTGPRTIEVIHNYMGHVDIYSLTGNEETMVLDQVGVLTPEEALRQLLLFNRFGDQTNIAALRSIIDLGGETAVWNQKQRSP